jgi:hypothetical protein
MLRHQIKICRARSGCDKWHLPTMADTGPIYSPAGIGLPGSEQP